MRSSRRRRAGTIPKVAAVLAVTIAAALAACSDDDDRAAIDDDPVAPPADETLAPLDEEPQIDTIAEIDRTFITEVLADDVVTADELASAYDRYVECLAEGGGFGRYAYDIDLDSTITVDWQLAADDRFGSASASLDATCSASFLGDLERRYRADNPPPDDISTRQRASVVACVEAIDPAAAAQVPSEITTDTGAPTDAVLIYDVQLDPTAFDVGEAEAEEIAMCFITLGAPWHDFGEPPDDFQAPTPPPPFVPETEPSPDDTTVDNVADTDAAG